MDELTEKILETNPDWAWPNWPITVFLSDLKKYPVEEDKLLQSLHRATDDYLLFFRESRGYPRPFGYYIDLWKDITSNPVLLHLEKDVSYLLLLSEDEYVPEDDDLLALILMLANEDQDKWPRIVDSMMHQKDEDRVE